MIRILIITTTKIKRSRNNGNVGQEKLPSTAASWSWGLQLYNHFDVTVSSFSTPPPSFLLFLLLFPLCLLFYYFSSCSVSLFCIPVSLSLPLSPPLYFLPVKSRKHLSDLSNTTLLSHWHTTLFKSNTTSWNKKFSLPPWTGVDYFSEESRAPGC